MSASGILLPAPPIRMNQTLIVHAKWFLTMQRQTFGKRSNMHSINSKLSLFGFRKIPFNWICIECPVYRTRRYYNVLTERFIQVKGGWIKVFYNTAYTAAAAKRAPEDIIIPLMTKQFAIEVYCANNGQFNGSKYFVFWHLTNSGRFELLLIVRLRNWYTNNRLVYLALKLNATLGLIETKTKLRVLKLISYEHLLCNEINSLWIVLTFIDLTISKK